MPRDEDFLDGVPFDEAERRRLVLFGIRERMKSDGPHHAAMDPKRAAQFLPFAALEGFDNVAAKAEKRSSTAAESGGAEVFDVP